MRRRRPRPRRSRCPRRAGPFGPTGTSWPLRPFTPWRSSWSRRMRNAAALEAVEWLVLGFKIIDCPLMDWKFQPADFVAAYGLHASLIVGKPSAVTAANISRARRAAADVQGPTVERRPARGGRDRARTHSGVPRCVSPKSHRRCRGKQVPTPGRWRSRQLRHADRVRTNRGRCDVDRRRRRSRRSLARPSFLAPGTARASPRRICERSAFAFAAVHLPAWTTVGPLSPGLALMVMILNSLGGLVFGYVFVTRGIVAAIWRTQAPPA
jgi:hypothetical protein